MLLCPVQNSAVQFYEFWKQARPRITQIFGVNPEIYKRFGMKGHNGIDYGVKVGTPIFAPFSGWVKVISSKDGYGLHVKIRSKERKRECVLAHLSSSFIKDGSYINMGDKIGLSGNTGFSTGPHLHYGVRRLIESKKKDVFLWKVEDYDNGYYGYFDPINYTITWKGTSVLNTL